MAANNPPVNLRDAFFMVMVSGQIESAEVGVCHYVTQSANFMSALKYTQFPDFDQLYCTYSYSHGQDWTIVSVSDLQLVDCTIATPLL